jgi:hypothetical protein
MTRVCVDKQTRTTAAIKKYVDKGYLSWYERAWDGAGSVEIVRDSYETRRKPMKSGYLIFMLKGAGLAWV